MQLTTREKEIMELLVEGNSSQVIADKLVLSIRTVRNTLSHIYAKNNIRGQLEAAILYLKEK